MDKSFTGNKIFGFYVLLFIIAIGLYANTFKHGFVLDDDIVFVKNKYVQEGVSAIPKIVSHGFLYGFNSKNDQSYRPLVTVEFAIAKSLFGNNPHAHHRMQVLYYAILCCLLFHFLRTLFNHRNPWLAFWISLLFVLHPVHTEVVANIKSRDEIFQAVFLIAALLQALLYVDRRRKKYLYYSLLFFFMALLSKEMAISFIALLPLTLWFSRAVKPKQLLKITAYHFGVLLLYFLLRLSILDTVTFDEEMTVLNNGLMAADNLADRIASTFYIFANYIKLLFYPSPLSWDYSYPHFPIVSFANPIVIFSVVALLTLGVISLLTLPSKNKYAFSFLFFVIPFSVVSNFFILIGSTLGERFLFFPSIAFCLFFVWLIYDLSGQLKKTKYLPAVVMLLIALFYSIKTIDRNKDWSDNASLFMAGIESTPNNTRAVGAVANVYMNLAERSSIPAEKRNYYTKAIENYKRSIELLPSNADSYYNLGVIYMNTNQIELSKANFEKTIAIAPKNLKAINNLGVIYFNQKDFQKALQLFEECVRANPNFQQAVANLGAVYHNLGKPELAKEYYRKALELNPNDRNTRNNLLSL